MTAADERRHGVAHMSEFLSVRDLIKRVEERLPPDTEVPSAALVRLQFTPCNPYTAAATQFTSRFNIIHKIQVNKINTLWEGDG